MRIIITVPEGQAVEYMEFVAGQIEDGCTSGHVDAQTWWEIEA